MLNISETSTSAPQDNNLKSFLTLDPQTFGFRAKNVRVLLALFTKDTKAKNPQLSKKMKRNSKSNTEAVALVDLCLTMWLNLPE